MAPVWACLFFLLFDYFSFVCEAKALTLEKWEGLVRGQAASWFIEYAASFLKQPSFFHLRRFCCHVSYVTTETFDGVEI